MSELLELVLEGSRGLGGQACKKGQQRGSREDEAGVGYGSHGEQIGGRGVIMTMTVDAALAACQELCGFMKCHSCRVPL